MTLPAAPVTEVKLSSLEAWTMFYCAALKGLLSNCDFTSPEDLSGKAKAIADLAIAHWENEAQTARATQGNL